jgi:hypothetical protein
MTTATAPYTLDIQVDLLRAEMGRWQSADGAVVFDDGEAVLLQVTNRGSHQTFATVFLRASDADPRPATHEIDRLPALVPTILGAATPLRLSTDDEAVVLVIADDPEVLDGLLEGQPLDSPEYHGFALFEAPVRVVHADSVDDEPDGSLLALLYRCRYQEARIATVRAIADAPLSATSWQAIAAVLRRELDESTGIARRMALEVCAGSPLSSLRDYVRGAAEDSYDDCRDAAWQALADARDPSVLPDLLGYQFDPIRLAGFNLTAAQAEQLPEASSADEHALWVAIIHARAGDLGPLDAVLRAERPATEAIAMPQSLLAMHLTSLGPLPYRMIFQLSRLANWDLDQWAADVVQALLAGSKGPGGNRVGGPPLAADQASQMHDRLTSVTESLYGALTTRRWHDVADQLLSSMSAEARGALLVTLASRCLADNLSPIQWTPQLVSAFGRRPFTPDVPGLARAYLACRARIGTDFVHGGTPASSVWLGAARQIAWLTGMTTAANLVREIATSLDDPDRSVREAYSAFVRDVLDCRRSSAAPPVYPVYEPPRAMLARIVVDDRASPPARTAHAQLRDPSRPLRVGQPTLIAFSIGPWRMDAPPGPDVPQEPADIVVALFTDDALIAPAAHRVALSTWDPVGPLDFSFTPQRVGLIELRFRIFTGRSSVLLQELTAQVPVLPQEERWVEA